MKKLETLQFKKFCMTIGNLPASYVDSMSYYECLLWLIKYLQEEVIPTVNNNSEAVTELQGLFIELQSYVENYFDNLDVQEEINNKLDEMAEEGTLQEIIADYLNSKAVFGFDTVADMKEATNLIDGSYAQTLGYYSINDGGKGVYKIRTITNEDVVNGGTIIAMNDDSLVAELIYTDELNVAQFGAKGDGVTDDTEKIQNMLDSLKYGMTGKFINDKIYLISYTLQVKSRTNIDGNYCFIKLDDDFTSNGYAFEYGTTNESSVEDSFLIKYNFKNFNIYHFGEADSHYYNGILIKKDVYVDNIYTWGLDITVKVTNDYIDYTKITNINIWGKHGNNFAIDTGFLGDNRVISNVHQYLSYDNNGTFNTLKVGSGHNCVKIDGIINGYIEINGSNVDMQNIHLEKGNITIKGKAEVNIDNAYIWKTPSEVPINITSTGMVNISNLLISYRNNKDYSSDNAVDLSFTNRNVININNCYKTIQANDDITFKQYTGIKTNKDSYNLNETNNSRSSTTVGSFTKSVLNTMKRIGSYSILGTFYKDDNCKWLETTGTYYYKAIMMFDPVRLVGNSSNANELNNSLTNNEGGAYITINGTPYSNYRVYRGTTTGSYNKYADIGISDSNIADNGIICNCTNWVSREAGAEDTILNADSYEIINMNNVKVLAGSIPTVGTWNKGDIIINNNPTASGALGWICTTSGTPGTWKVISNIAE